MLSKILGIDNRLAKAVLELGFTQPTEIQEKAIPALLEGNRDLIGLAQTGTGKTAAFGLPLIQSINVENSYTQALVLCPTRELCLQITTELQRYAKYVEGLNIVAVYGGADIQNQIRNIKRGAHIVVGTPGRLLDHISRKTLSLHLVNRVVLDEADQMLDMGFHEDIDTILKTTPQEKRVWLFSATMQPKIEKIAHKYMNNPLQITVGSRNSSAANIEHYYCIVKKGETTTAVRCFLDYYPEMFGIIFCRTKKDVQEMCTQLVKDGYHADALHGDLSQAQRDAVMRKFRNKQISVLIATDVAARGIDVDGVTHVLHCDIPEDIENYTHRSGRTARAGKSGISISITTPKTSYKIKSIEKIISKPIALMTVPTGPQICGKQLAYFSETIINTIPDDEVIKPYLQSVSTNLDSLSKEELIERILSLNCGELLKKYEHTPNINASADSRSSSSSSSSRRRENLYNGNSSNATPRMFINIGKMDGLNTDKLIKLIVDNAPSIKTTSLGKISMQNTRSFFTVFNRDSAQTIISSLRNSTHRGRKIRVEFEVDQQ